MDEIPDLRPHPPASMPQPVLVLFDLAHCLSVCPFELFAAPEYRLIVCCSAITEEVVTDVRSDDEDDDDDDEPETKED